MNFLGHIYFSYNQPEVAMVNLYGDFFRGSNFNDIPEFVANGIRYHREIDSYIDHHDEISRLLTLIQLDLPKVSAIAIDLFFDHLLAKNWLEFHSVPLRDYLDLHYVSFQKGNSDFSEKFNGYLKLMVERDWISVYGLDEGLEKLCNGVSSRISFENELKKGHLVFKKYELEITQAFYLFMKDAEIHFSSLLENYFPEVLFTKNI